ncbi:hypothetical protein HZA43_03250 [Candidatus Peregrinibacteria bacterium]|nr:hypothetical protein [Candidatus Peregrinibacteria bacterium]
MTRSDKTPIPDDEMTDISQLRPLEPLNPKEFRMNGLINTVRQNATGALKYLGIVTAAGVIAGTTASSFMEHRPHQWLGYEHATPEEVKAAETPEDKTDSGRTKGGQESGILDHAGDLLGKAKKWAGKEMKDFVDQSEVMQRYREAKEKGLMAADRISFWLSFLTAFYAAAKMARLILKTKKSLGQSVDPTVERALERIVAHINRLTERANTLARLSVDSAEETRAIREETLALAGQFESAIFAVEELPDEPRVTHSSAPSQPPIQPRRRVPRAML